MLSITRISQVGRFFKLSLLHLCIQCGKRYAQPPNICIHISVRVGFLFVLEHSVVLMTCTYICDVVLPTTLYRKKDLQFYIYVGW